LKLALLSDAATQQFVPVLRTLLDANGFSTDVYEGGFDASSWKSTTPRQSFIRSIRTGHPPECRSGAARFVFDSGRNSATDFVSESLARITAIWNANSIRSRGLVIQALALPLERYFGNYDLKVSNAYFVTCRVNSGIAAGGGQQNGVLIKRRGGSGVRVGRKPICFDE